MSSESPPTMNIIHYQNNPFSTGLVLSKLAIETKSKIDYQYLSSVLRALRKKFNLHVFIHDGDDILVAGEPPEGIELTKMDMPHAPSFKVSVKESISLKLAEPKQHLLLERIFGEAIATWIRQHRLGGWIVVEGRNAMFEAEKSFNELRNPSLEIWKGFVYTPKIDQTGQARVIVDPRFKLYPTFNLREQIDKLTPEIKRKLKEMPLILDSCLFNECPIRADPYGPCRFIGSGRYVKLVNLDYERTPSDIEIGTDNLVEYNENLCPLGLLNGRYLDEPPIASIQIGNRSYDYLPERLRLRLDIAFQLLDPDTRRRTTRMLQIPPDERFQMTKEIWTVISKIDLPGIPRLDGIGLVKSGSFEPYQEWDVFTSPNLAVGSIRNVTQPYRMLVQYGPYDKPIDESSESFRFFSKIQIQPVILAKSITPRVEKALNIFDDFFAKHEANSFSSIYSVETDVKPGLLTPNNEKLPEIVHTLVDLHNDNEPLITYLLIDQNYDDLASEVRAILFDKNMRFQSSHLKTFLDARKIKGVLRNIGISVYSKSGGIPWILAHPLNDDFLFVGLKSIPLKDEDITSVNVVNNDGRWLMGCCQSIAKSQYSNRIVELTSEIQEKFQNKKHIIIHYGGRINYYREIRPISDAISDGSLDSAKISLIEITKSRVRLYNRIGNRQTASPRGTYAKYEDRTAALLTTVAPHGTPNPINVRVILGDPNHLEKRANEVFQLTNVYYGYERALTGSPITLHSCEKSIELFQSDGILTKGFIDYPWFIQQ